MTQAICDITTDEVNVDVVVEPQADTMVEVANRAGGMEQVFHDKTLIGNGNSVDLGVNTEIIASKEYVDEKFNSVDTYTKAEIDHKVIVINTEIDANADAIQKTREDFISADSEIHQILNNHASELTTLRGNQASLGDQVSGIEEKIPGDASATNQLATKADLKDIDLDGYVKKSGDTMTGDLAFDVAAGGYNVVFQDSYKNVNTGNNDSVIKRISSTHQSQGLVFSESKNGTVDMQFTMVADGFFMPFGNRLLGSVDFPWNNIYAKKLNNGADIAIPTEGGTLARVEDLIDLRADINEADSELQTQITAQAAEIAGKQDQLIAGDNITIVDNVISATGGGGGGGIANVIHDATLTGSGTNASPLGLAETIKDEIADKAPKETVEALTQAVNGIIGDYLPLSGGTLTGALSFDVIGDTYSYVPIIVNADGENLISAMSDGAGKTTGKSVRIDKLSAVELTTQKIGGAYNAAQHIYVAKIGSGKDASLLTVPDGTGTIARIEDIAESVNTKDLTVGTEEGTLNIGIVAGTATIATNNGLDIVAQTKFDTAPMTDDNTTWANASEVSLVRKAQVATAIADAVANIDALPDQSGNAGKVLTTDGSTASWQEPQGGGTKIIIKRYN